MHWCHNETALGEAEIEYYNRRSPSNFIVSIIDGKGKIMTFTIPGLSSGPPPWTIPANLAICLHPEYSYVRVGTRYGGLILAEELLAEVMEVLEYHPIP